jgi:hypothetical protein
MPAKPISLWITTSVPDAEDYETELRFKQFAKRHKNYVKALKSLLDAANIPKPL